ncbi:MAG: ECF transporter S component [Actinomycetota bacterium]|nr:ECF transporter S component [Actinomycetota bacterium]
MAERAMSHPASEDEGALSIRKIVIAGVLAAIAILLGVTRIGFIPFPTGINATIMHVPAIIGAVVAGPVVGAIIGTIFGIFSMLNATVPLFKDPLVAILPRIFIGITAFYAYWALRHNQWLALGAAAVVGTLTNTILVLTMAVVRGYMPPNVATTVAVTHGIPEVIVAAIITYAVAVPWLRLRGGRQEARRV